MIEKNESLAEIVQHVLGDGPSPREKDYIVSGITTSAVLFGSKVASSTDGAVLQFSEEENLIMDNIYIWIFLGTFGAAGIIFNLIVIYGLLRVKCNGARYYLLQLAFCDIATLAICGLELFYMNYQRWTPIAELCPVYLGLESFTSTASTYFIIALNLHAISIYNLTLDAIGRQIRAENIYSELQPDPVENDHYETIQEVHERRSLTIDYRRRKRGIPVLLPALLVWFLGASMAIPLFVFGNVIPDESEPLVCGVMNFDRDSNLMMQIFIGVIRILVPIVCLHVSIGCVILKLHFTKDELDQCGLEENAIETMKLAVLLGSTLAIFGMQKLYGSLFFEIVSKPFMNYKYPTVERTVGMALSTISFILPAARPVMYLVMDRRLFESIFRCCVRTKRMRRRGRCNAIEEVDFGF